MRRRRVWLSSICFLLIAGAAMAWIRSRRTQGSRTVLIITIDTMRADAAGRDKGTPSIAEFLDRSTHFVRTRTVAPLTLPAHTSIFTGLSPAQHGVHDNKGLIPSAGGRPYSLLAEQYRAAGFDTAAFVSSGVLGRQTGLSAGFQVYFAPPPSAGPEYVPAQERVDQVLKWLDGRERGRPLFLWVHFFDVHAPYRRFAGDADHPGAGESAAPRDLYAGEVRRVDAAIGRLLAAAGREALVVIASDHGESLGEHGEREHGLLCYASTLDVFLAVRAGSLEPGAVETGLRSLCDLAPSLRRWSGLAGSKSDGLGLDVRGSPRVLVSESLHLNRISNWGQCFAATDGRFSLVESGPRLEMFDRDADPGELGPRPPLGHEAYERLDRALEAYRSRQAAGPGFVSDAASPYGVGRRASELYLSRASNGRLVDPHTRLSYWYRVERAERFAGKAIASGNPERARQAISKLASLADEDPRNPAPRFSLSMSQAYLARVLDDASLYRASALSARRAVALGYRVSPVLRHLIEVSLGARDPDELFKSLETAKVYRIVPDLGCAELAARASLTLTRSGHPRARVLGRRIVEQARRAPLSAYQLRRIDAIEESLR